MRIKSQTSAQLKTSADFWSAAFDFVYWSTATLGPTSKHFWSFRQVHVKVDMHSLVKCLMSRKYYAKEFKQPVKIGK